MADGYPMSFDTTSHVVFYIYAVHGSLNIAMVLLPHQALRDPSTYSPALNRREVKLVFCLEFEVPLRILQYGQKSLAQYY